jgi:hypothetical protein
MAINLANNNSLANITALPSSVSGGAMTLLSTQTASSSATISFTSGIDSTYDSYVFKFYDIHPANDDVHFQFQADTGTNTSYNQTMTTTTFNAIHFEDDSSATLQYSTNLDQAQGTSFQILSTGMGNENDQNVCGELKIFNPSSDTFVKHFIYNGNNNEYRNASYNQFVAGYFNLTTALTRFQFKMSSGNIDSGVIKLYGIS